LDGDDDVPALDAPVVDVASKESQERGLRIAGVVDRVPRIEDLVASCA
jgi:hypothetical protein